jgi:hypothetical protein
VLKFNPVRSVLNYLNEVKVELSKVTWPKNKRFETYLGSFDHLGCCRWLCQRLDYVFTKILEKS